MQIMKVLDIIEAPSLGVTQRLKFWARQLKGGKSC